MSSNFWSSAGENFQLSSRPQPERAGVRIQKSFVGLHSLRVDGEDAQAPVGGGRLY
jgi:hypothetical protein